jgi:beta-glucanase (GH16 family)
MSAITTVETATCTASEPCFPWASGYILVIELAMLLSTPAFAQTLRSKSAVPIAAPSPAVDAGFNTLTFHDEFDSLKTIDVNATKRKGYNWYTDLPFSGGRTLPSAYSISDGILTVTSTGWTANWALSSFSPGGNVGQSFQYGYFEARMRFDPALGPKSEGWPAFWSLSAGHAATDDQTHWAELDFFEAYTGGHASYSGAFVGTIHDWAKGSTVHYQNSNNWQPRPGVDYSQWHVYGCLWKPGQVTWYFDGTPLITESYSAKGTPNPPANAPLAIQHGVFHILDREVGGMTLILGSSPGWPMQVDNVRVWQHIPPCCSDGTPQ